MKGVCLVMGSENDFKYAERIGRRLKDYGIEFSYRVSSGHKTTEKTLDLTDEYDIFGAIAGRSDALSAVTDGNTSSPVYACRPDTDEDTRLMDTWSSLRMPSDICPMTVLGAGMAACQIARAYPTESRIEAREGKAPRVSIIWDARIPKDMSTKVVEKCVGKVEKLGLPCEVHFADLDGAENPELFPVDESSLSVVVFTNLESGRYGHDNPAYAGKVMDVPFLVCPDTGLSKPDMRAQIENALTGESPSIYPLVMDPGNAGLAAVKLLGVYHPEIREALDEHMKKVREKIRDSDMKVMDKTPW